VSSNRKRLPIVEDLVIPPHNKTRQPLLARLKYKMYAELAMGTLEPWERRITNLVIFAILAVSVWQLYAWGVMLQVFLGQLVSGEDIADAARTAGFV